VSGFSPVTLSFMGLVFVVALCLSILAVRRDHPDHVHALWYVFSLTFCAMSVLFFYIYEHSRAIQSTPLGGMTGTIAVTFMKASMDVREEIYILLTAGALLILPQILSYLISGIFGCGSPPILVSTVSRVVTWSLIKFFCVLSGMLAAQSTLALYGEPYLRLKDAPVKFVEALLMICLSFLIMSMYYKAEGLYASIAAYPRLKWLDSVRRFMVRYRKNTSVP
jgi:hypothetical protein